MDSNVLITAGAILIGTLVGAGATFGTLTWIEIWKRRKVKEGVANLFMCDIKSNWVRYYNIIGKEIEQHNKKDLFRRSMHIRHNYFSVFDNNSDKILYLDHETGSNVVELYIRAKAYIDIIDSYSEDLDRYYELEVSERGEAETRLKELFSLIRKEHNELKKIVSVTKMALSRELKET